MATSTTNSRNRWPWRLLVTAMVITLLVAAGFHWFNSRYPTPLTPEIPLEGVEPPVVEVIDNALAAVREQPRSAEAWGRLGQVLRAHQFVAEADVCFGHADHLDPLNPRWPFYQGLERLNRSTDAAIPFLQRSVDLCDRFDAANTSPRLLLGETLLAKGEIQEATVQFDRVFAKEPHNFRVIYDLGLAALAREDLETSAAFLRQCAVSPYGDTNKKACGQLAAIYRRMNDILAAEQFGLRAKLLPDDRPWNDPYVTDYLKLEVGRQSQYRRAEELDVEQKFREVEKLLRDLGREYPNEKTQVILGIVLTKAKRYADAEQVLRDALRMEPEKVQAHYFLSVALYHQSEGEGADRTKLQEAAAQALEAARLKPDHAFAHIYRGLALKRLDQLTEAIACFRLALRCRPEIVDTHLHLGEALVEVGQRDEGRQELEQAAKLAAPNDTRARQALEKLTKLKAEG